jgi:hypothetical protein
VTKNQLKIMITDWAGTPKDRELVSRLQALSNERQQYWDFRLQAKRHAVHGLIQYPAMMIPQMQAALLEEVHETHGPAQKVLDPFVGAGTMLTETMRRGLDFTGFDINPLALLACKVKAGPYHIDSLTEKTRCLFELIDTDIGRTYAVTFPGQAKWFTSSACIALSRVRRAIERETAIWARRFYWLALAETIRQCSNSRTSTYKLHVKPEEEIKFTNVDVVSIFKGVVTTNLERAKAQKQRLQEAGVLTRGHYAGDININYQDSSSINQNRIKTRFDLLFTSPPYGDNLTTIPYGQFSFLALKWIPIVDIDPSLTNELNKTTHSIDSASLGGSLKLAQEKAKELSEFSQSFRNLYKEIEKENVSASKRLASFCFDLHRCINSVVGLMARDAYMVWTLGNRSIAGRRVPLDKIVWNLLESKGAERVVEIVRAIPSKRMPVRNKQSETMCSETVIIARCT